MKTKISILMFYFFVSLNLFAQAPFNIDASKNTTVIIQLNKKDCQSSTNFHSNWMSISTQAPYFMVFLDYFSNCGTVDRMKIAIAGDSIHLIQTDSGQQVTCACEYYYSIIFQNYLRDSCVVFFGDTSVIYYNKNAAVNGYSRDISNIIIKNTLNTLEIDIPNANNGSYSMELYSVEGRCIKAAVLNNAQTIFDINSLDNGIYLVAIKNNGVIIKSKKLMKI